MEEKIRHYITVLVEIVFSIAYIAALVLAILDIFGIVSLFNFQQWMKILVMLFCTVGVIILSDKHNLEINISKRVAKIAGAQTNLLTAKDSIMESVANINHILEKQVGVTFFPDKTQFYLYLTEILLKLPNGARVDVTNFEKNYNVPYDVGENTHIESFMKTWTDAVRNGKVTVRQLVHITSPQDYRELIDRIDSFKENSNFAISTIIGLPIAPFVDIMILNQEYVVVGLSNDISSPNNLSFGYSIKSRELALSYESYFNIYWSNQFSVLVKDKDEVKRRNLASIKQYVYDVDHNADLKRYYRLLPGIYHINEQNKNFIEMLEVLNSLYGNACYSILDKQIERKTEEYCSFINEEFVEFERDKATDLISKMIFNSQDRICATSLDIGGNEFWASADGETVFQANIDAIFRKKVHIERVFICSSEKQAKMKDIIDAQVKAGISVYYTEYKKGMGAVFEDFLIVDDEALLLFSKDKIMISIKQQKVQAYLKKFEQFKKMGNPITDYEEDLVC